MDRWVGAPLQFGQCLFFFVGHYPLSKRNCISYLGANGVLELNNDMTYHENDSEDCIYIARKFKEFNESSINSLPGKGGLQKFKPLNIWKFLFVGVGGGLGRS